VRKALSLALNRGKICRTVLKSGVLPAFALVPPRIPGYAGNHGDRENPELARQLLTEAGHPEGRGVPELSLLCPDAERNRLVAKAIQTIWQEELNVQARVEVHNSQTYRQRVAERDFDFMPLLWVGDYVDPSAFLDMYQSPSRDYNYTGWENAAYRALIEQADVEIDPEKRLRLYADAERILIKETPVISLFHTVSVHLLKPYVIGIEPNLMNSHPLKSVTIAPY
jgi:ABC-type oligopeptide transport system substrate-binding subunit